MGFLSNVLGSGVLGGIGGVIQSVINSRTQRQNVDKTNAANLALAKLQYSNEIDMWNKANAYNSPSAQMQRFKDAGLNPNLIYGQGNSGNSPNVLPQYHAPRVSYDYLPSVNLPETISMFQDYRIKSAQLDNLKAQAETTKASTAIKLLQAADWSAKNWFNFGNRDFSKWDWKGDIEGTKGGSTNYQQANYLKYYQASVAKATVDEMIKSWRIKNNIAVNQERAGKISNQIAEKELNWYIFNTLAGAISKVGMGAAVGGLIRKRPIINNTKYQSIYNE